MRRKGFTLIELVMVMVIVGLLAAIIVPKVATQKDHAKEKMTRANLKNLRTAINIYHAQEGVWPDVGTFGLSQLTGDQPSPSGATYISKIPIDGYLLKNTPHQQMFCPS